MSSAKQLLLDRMSIGASVVCAIHCAAMPIILAMFPALSFLPSDNHTFHSALVWLIVPLSGVAAYLGCSKHRDKFVFFGITLGLTLLIVTALFGHDLIGDLGEKIATITATITLSLAHGRNYLLCRKRKCSQ